MSEEKVYKPKMSQLIFYRQYNTYQALLDVIPRSDMSMDDCFSKVVLHIMAWFKERIGNDAIDIYPELKFLNTEYPDLQAYKEFDVSKTTDINYLSCLDVKTAYVEDKKAWVFRLNEADNGKEEKDIQGRTFTTRVAVYMKDDAARETRKILLLMQVDTLIRTAVLIRSTREICRHYLLTAGMHCRFSW